MTTYSYAQLEGLWIQAGGSKSLAPVMAAIAEAESGGNPAAYNASGATGLWQILGAVNPADQSKLTDPATNAHEAVLKYQSQGLSAWVTYTSGAYKQFLSNSTTPNTNVPGSGGGSSGGSGGGSSSAGGTQPGQLSPDCMMGFGGISGTSWINDIFSSGGNTGAFCVWTYSQGRAVIGTLLLGAAGVVGLVGLALLAVDSMGGARGVGHAAGGVLEGTGAALAFVPGAEGAGLAVGAAGAATRHATKPGAAGRSLDRRRQRRAAAGRQPPADQGAAA